MLAAMEICVCVLFAVLGFSATAYSRKYSLAQPSSSPELATSHFVLIIIKFVSLLLDLISGFSCACTYT